MNEIKKNGFIELDFIASVAGKVFDTTLLEEAEKAGLVNEKNKGKFKPVRICVGERMLIKGLDEALIGKKIGSFSVSLEPEKAFGKRNPALLKTMPLSVFSEHNTKPIPGALFQFDNLVGKILGVSGGRVIVDFNNPLFGKTVEYKVNIKKIIKDKKEKVDALIKYYFPHDYIFEKDIVKIKEVPKVIEKVLSEKLWKLNVKLSAEKSEGKAGEEEAKHKET